MTMIDLGFLHGQSYEVLGLGRSGLSAARALVAGGARVTAWDDNAERRQDAQAQQIPVADLAAHSWGAGDHLVLSPGIPHSFPAPHPVAAAARAAGVPILCDIELLALAQPDERFVGITGTNGKSTVTALTGHILKTAGHDARVGGNIGVPVADFDPVGPGGVYVLEMSSYQLELTHSLGFDVAVLLNIAPDHLDRHGGMDGYVAAKRRIFRGDASPDIVPQTAIIGMDDQFSREVAEAVIADGRFRLVPISVTRRLDDGMWVEDGKLHEGGRLVMDLNGIDTLRGVHNHQNAAAAWAVASALDVPEVWITEAMRSFPGLAHRQELVANDGGIRFVNDSKATNGDAAARALASYGDIHWIAGGQAKEGGLEAMDPALFDHVRAAYLIGDAQQEFAATLDARGVAHHLCGDLETALGMAHEAARAAGSGTVLLSPACASFDQFSSYEQRGDRFRALVLERLGEGRP